MRKWHVYIERKAVTVYLIIYQLQLWCVCHALYVQSSYIRVSWLKNNIVKQSVVSISR
jgi:hypothetical protein